MEEQTSGQYIIQPGTMLYRRCYRYTYICERYPGEPYYEPDIVWIPCIVTKMIEVNRAKTKGYDFEVICYAKDYAKVNFLEIDNDADITKLKVSCKISFRQIGIDFYLSKERMTKYKIHPAVMFDDNSEKHSFLICEEGDKTLKGTIFEEDRDMFFECDLDDEPFIKEQYNKFNYSEKYKKLLTDDSIVLYNSYDKRCTEANDTNLSGRFCPYCNFVKLHRQEFDFDFESLDDIFYFKNYYPTEVCKKYNNEYYWHNNNLVLNFKKDFATQSKTYNSALYFYKCIENRVSRLKGTWIICSIPGHNQLDDGSNAISDMMERYNKMTNVRFCNDLIVRTKENLPKAQKEYGLRDYKRDLETMHINEKYKYTLPKANVIILDDIVTSGTSFIAAKKLMLVAGVQNVVCMAFAKTITEIEIKAKELEKKNRE